MKKNSEKTVKKPVSSNQSLQFLYKLFYDEFKIKLEKLNAYVINKKLTPQNKVSGILEGSLAFFLFNIFNNLVNQNNEKTENNNDANLIFLTSDDLTALKLYEELVFLHEQSAGASGTSVNKGTILFFPSWGILPFTYSKPDSRKEAHRARTLSSLFSEQKTRFIITSVDSVVQKIPGKAAFEKNILKFELHEKYNYQMMSSFFSKLGYERVDLVENYGQFCIKGNIIDIFSPLFFNPVRLDFFGDDLERIVLFDPDTQKTTESLPSIQIFPRHDISISEDEIDKLIQILKTKKLPVEVELPAVLIKDKLRQKSNEEHDFSGLWDIFPLIYECSSFLDYFNDSSNHKATLISVEDSRIDERLTRIEEEITFLRNRGENKFMLDKHELFIDASEFHKKTSDRIRVSAIPESPDELKISMKHSPIYKGKISSLLEDIKNGIFHDKKIFISAKSNIQIDRLNHIISGYVEKIPDLYILEAPFETGFETDKFVLLTEKDIFGKSSRTTRLQKNASAVIQSFTDLKNGDYVVHINYGIGCFKSLRRMQVAGFERDFIEIEFAEANKLYVPIDQLQYVHKYIGSSEHPKLDYLGKKSAWAKTKSKVSEAIELMAAELLDLYARREKSKGIEYPPDSRFQEEFEAAFPFEETEHQQMAINEVKKDMESEKPMDRLVCGDVGFGKTEVAIRAAFKAVMAGRQVGILCPTTILAFQHFNTFKKRFENYPVKIEMMSRFRSAGEMTNVMNETKKGNVDIVIGTHAVLSSKMAWKNLGLLVIDEEQRFGVKHKEHIKGIKSNVDCLTMTATPIPRTMQMSLIGIRDLSIIETPPRNRLKIETYVLEENDEILRQAIKHELERNGQVIVLHNRVQTIDVQASRIKNLLPIAEVLVMHGQMSEDDIESRMLDFYQKKFNVLVSTTIIESGVDLPDANTLIVLSAHAFGLSQLYQIKGRVGRSDRQAFAYFFYHKGEVMTEKAQKRLNTLMEYDGLGDGFKIAMKDLEIRGAGNILGKEQSGDIMAVGFELYINMLHDKLSELKNDVKPEDFECTVSVAQNYFIPDQYIPDIRQKMEFYKKLTSVTDLTEIENLISDMHDRFGEVPESVESMFMQEKLRLIGKTLKFEKIVYLMIDNKPIFSLTASPAISAGIDKIIRLIQKDKRFSLDESDARKMNFTASGKSLLANLKEINSILEYLL
ncbi:MAG: transcription-repair coupling factor [Spirochaetia bacterium]|nr:transcription-repair coupling factor [Spirochaetia bacterium]